MRFLLSPVSDSIGGSESWLIRLPSFFPAARPGPIRPVAFERDTADPFGVDAFLESAKQGGGAGEKKRGLDTGEDERRKRARED